METADNSMGGFWRRVATMLVAIAAMCATRATAADPDGILKMKLGMTPAAFKLSYPGAVEEAVTLPGTSVPAPSKFQRYSVTGLSVGPLRNCTLTAAFFNEYLYQVQANCAAAQANIEAYLTKQYGRADYEKKPFKFWTGESNSVSYSSAKSIFVVENRQNSQQASWALMHARRQALGSQPTGTAGTPAPPAGSTAGPKPQEMGP